MEEAETGSQGEGTSLCNDPKVRKKENVKQMGEYNLMELFIKELLKIINMSTGTVTF